MEYILFSPIGRTDPISYYRDGGLLHICRKYKPQKVYIYLSEEMLANSNDDDRYMYSLNMLKELVGFDCQVIKIEKSNLENVHLFDSFYNEFDAIIKDISAENKNATVILNVSSGTPAMKSALELISATSTLNLKAIQVSSPFEREKSVEREYLKDLEWECNKDNNPAEFKDRCNELTNLNLIAKINKQLIKAHIQAYNYSAALAVAKTINNALHPDVLQLLQALVYRVQLNKSEMFKITNKMNYDVVPKKTGKQQDIFEYLLELQIKQKNGQLADFVRGITPVVLDLFELCLLEKCKIDVRDCCRKETKRNGEIIYYVDATLKDNNEKTKMFYQALLENFNGKVESKFYSSIHILIVLKKYIADADLIAELEFIRTVESNLRNITAHEIVSITDDFIEKQLGKGNNSKKIMKCIKSITVKSGLKFSKDDWNSYDNANNLIIDLL